MLHTVAQLDGRGEFHDRGIRTASRWPICLLHLGPGASHGGGRGQCVPDLADREPLEASAAGDPTAWMAGIRPRARRSRSSGVSGDAAQRLDPGTWAGVETTLADLARLYRPDALAQLAPS